MEYTLFSSILIISGTLIILISVSYFTSKLLFKYNPLKQQELYGRKYDKWITLFSKLFYWCLSFIVGLICTLIGLLLILKFI